MPDATPSPLFRAVRSGTPSPASMPESEDPIRGELLSADRLEEHACSIADRRTLAEGKAGRPLSPRVRDSGRALLQCYRVLAGAIREEGAITPAAEWFVDNFHIVDDVVREVREDLPPGFYRQLPKLAEGPLHGYPRVLGLAWAFVAHTDSRFEAEPLQRFVRGFQRVRPLNIGELWAVPIALRVVLLENLRRLAERLVKGRAARHDADALANELLGLGGQPARPLAFQRLDSARLPIAFTVELVQRLREQDPDATPALSWLDEQLAARGTSPDELVRVEHHDQAAMNVTVRNVITSMRMMARFDWPEFFESVSLVDEMLRADRRFGAMDFATRDQYRHAIEDLARRSGRSELDVTRRAIARAQRAAEMTQGSGAAPDDRAQDPGYYLIGRGRRAFELDIGYRVPLKSWLLRAYVKGATVRYLGSIGVVTALLLAVPLLMTHAAGASAAALVLLALAALIPASELAVALVNRTVVAVVGPAMLPRLELRDGVPPPLRTLVVVPTLLTDEAEIAEHVDRLELHYLANPDGELRFALLSDWTDAGAETAPDDDRLLGGALEGIGRLNRRHGPASDGERSLSPAAPPARVERRRGPVDGLGAQARQASRAQSPAPRRDRHDLRGAPRRIARRAGRRPVRDHPRRRHAAVTGRGQATGRHHGASAQPCRAFDAQAGRVVDGYAVLQPRVTPTMPADREGSLFQRTFAGPAGHRSLRRRRLRRLPGPVRRGSYTGKGIYDVDAFEAALSGRAPGQHRC